MKDCLTCKNVCCLHAEISLNIFDAAKLLEYFPNYKIAQLNGCSNTNLDIFVNNIKIFEIRDNAPRIRLPIRCNFLNTSNLCEIHFQKISLESPLAKMLQEFGIPLNIKPMICRQHPIFFEPNENCLKEYENCELEKFAKSNRIENNKDSLDESVLICRSYYLLYEKLQQGMAIWDMILMLLEGKNPFI